jgi:hypothetical protein
MVFQKYGQACHLRIKSSADFHHVLALDEAHWVATGAATNTLRCDPVFLDLLDVDDNFRLMSYEIRVAIKWLTDSLTDFTGIDEASDVLKLSAIDGTSADGKKILTAVTKILQQCGKKDSDVIALSEVREVKKQQESLPVSEAGVVLPDASKDADLQQCIKEIIAATGGTPHPSGNPGLDAEDLDRFAKSATERLEWLAQVELKDGEKSDLMPLGVATRDAYSIFRQLKKKLDHYFAQCDAVVFDQRTAGHFLADEIELKEADLSDASAIEKLLKEAPLAPADPKKVLSFDEHINPAYAQLLEAFRSNIMEPLTDADDSLSKADWVKVKQVMSAHEKWAEAEPGKELGKLDPSKLTDYKSEKIDKELRKLIGEKSKTAYVLDNVRLAEKIILYQANMLSLLNNFVSFPDLYDPSKRALFEMGTLIVDGRHLNFSTKVEDIKAHSKIASTSDIFVVYADVQPADAKKPKVTVALPVTSGTKGNLHVGKRGVFRDLAGDILDAQIVKIIENPISLWETLMSPFTRIAKLITGRIEAMQAAAEKNIDSAATSVTVGAPAQQAGQQKGMMAGGLLMGGGVAIAALGSAFAFVAKTLAGLGPLKSLLGLLAAILAFVLPASIVAINKLRRRDISSILEGAGWSINARMHLNRTQGRAFTERPPLPEAAEILPDRSKWLWIALLCAVALFALYRMLGV